MAGRSLGEGWPMDTCAGRRKLFRDEAEARELVRAQGLGWIGSEVSYLDRTDSTNTRARRLAGLGRPEGTLVVAEYQTHGRGRLGRRWMCPARAGLLLSVLVERSRFSEQGGLGLPWLTAAGALAMARAAGDACRVVRTPAAGRVKPELARRRRGPDRPGRGDILVEWPNDLVAICPVVGSTALTGRPGTAWPTRRGKEGASGGRGAMRKLGGVLVEGQQDAPLLALGVGLNVDVRPDEFPPEVTPAAGSLLTAFGTAPERRAVLLGFLRGLEELLADVEGLPGELRKRSATLGREVTVRLDGRTVRARATGFDERMRLVVELPGGRVEAVASADML